MHYGAGEWTDFVRNLVSEKDRIDMEEHRAVCSQCGVLFEFLRKVAITGQNEQVYTQASEALTASARALFVSERAQSRVRSRITRALQTLTGKLTYDSAADLLPAGARAARPASRQMLYEVGDFCLDLRFDRETGSTKVTLVGQIANRRDPAFLVAKLPVLILSSSGVVAETESNEFGEFSLDYTPGRDLRVSVQIGNACIQIEAPVKGLSEAYET